MYLFHRIYSERWHLPARYHFLLVNNSSRFCSNRIHNLWPLNSGHFSDSIAINFLSEQYSRVWFWSIKLIGFVNGQAQWPLVPLLLSHLFCWQTIVSCHRKIVSAHSPAFLLKSDAIASFTFSHMNEAEGCYFSLRDKPRARINSSEEQFGFLSQCHWNLLKNLLYFWLSVLDECNRDAIMNGRLKSVIVPRLKGRIAKKITVKWDAFIAPW
jgi:hypothetical protein